MKIKAILIAIILAFLISSCKSHDKVIIPQKRPNVLFILVDDLGYHDLSFTGSNYYETPNIDSLANKSMIFTQGYAASRVCSPSRASIMTGQFTARHGITDWIGAFEGTDWRKKNRNDLLLPASYNHKISADNITMAEAFKAADYKTFFAGKWHLGDEGSHPEDHGFDINVGGWDSGSPKGGYFSPWNNPKLPNKVRGENLSMRLAQETSDFIKSHKDTSFFAFLSFYAVHSPIQTTQSKWQKFRDKAEAQGIADSGFEMERVLPFRNVQDNPIYAGLVESMDDAVGHILKTLRELGLTENTIIVFTSDNGGVVSGDNYSTSNLPLRGGKGHQWEGGIREPYFIYTPWLNSENKTTTYPVTGADFYPTVLDLANIELIPDQHKDGISLKPLFEGKSLPERPLYWHYPHYGNQGGEPSSIIREGKWKLIHYYEDDRQELYNLENDPQEQQNVSNSNPEITKSLKDKLKNWLLEVNANYPEKDPEYNELLAQKRKINNKTKLLQRLETERLNMLDPNFKPNENWWKSQITKD